MRTIIACSLFAMSLVGATPILAQGITVGPDGVGVDVGGRARRDYDRDDYRRDRYRSDRDDEGRSAYRNHREHGQRDDD